MTLVVTAVSRDIVIQLTDRQLTSQSNEVVDERANKSVIAQCSDARFVMSYTGWSLTKGGEATDWWAANCLFEMQSWGMRLAEVFNEFTNQLVNQFSGQTYVTTFIWAGFEYRDCNDGLASRMFIRKSASRGNASATHKALIQKPNFFLFVDGQVAAVSKVQGENIAVAAGNGIFCNKCGKSTIEALVPLIRDVSLSGGKGREFIGRNCTALALTPRLRDGTLTGCYSEISRDVADTPLAVLPNIGVIRLEVIGAVNPSWNTYNFN